MRFRRKLGASASAIAVPWTTVTLLSSFASALNFTSITLPTFSGQDYGRMGFFGAFQGISLFEYAEQGTQTYFTNGSNAVITSLPNGELTTLAVADGAINDMCLFQLKNGTVAGVIVGGTFKKFGGIQAEGVALVSPTTGQVIPLAGLSGSVNSLLCDQDQETVFVGGEFSGANSTNAIAWVGMVGWANLPFQGFNGPVESITKMSNGTVLFGGKFDALGNTTMMTNPNTGNSSKITEQFINLQTANLTSSAPSSLSGFSDPKNIVCSDGSDTSGNVFLMADGQHGTWEAQLAYTVYPTKLRLTNTHYEGRGLKTFRFVSIPNNGIMNLTSVDPVSNIRFYCDAWCPLSHDTNTTVPYQDFEFVNTIPSNSFRIETIEWYGAGAGLAGIEIFQDDVYSFAVNALNEPSCKDISTQSTSSVNGTWSTTGGPPETDSEYLTATLNGSALRNASITFKPDIKNSGIYTVLVYTPGCIQDNTCSSRGQVNVTGNFAMNQTDITQASYYQTNNYDKYDTLFHGYVDASSAAFTPEVVLKPRNDEDGTFNVVASKIRFILADPQSNSQTTSSAVTSSSTSEQLILNGIFAYNPTTVATVQGTPDTAVSIAGASLPTNITINSVVVKDNLTYVAGDIETTDFHNVISIDGNGAKSLADGGLNGIVTDSLLAGDILYLAGDFNDTVSQETAGLSHVAIYDTVKNTWAALGSGLNGPAAKIVSMQLNFTSGQQVAYAFSGNFTQILSSGSSGAVTVSNFAVWVPGLNDWLERLSNAPVRITGYLSSRVDIPNSQPFYSGSILSNAVGGGGGIGVGRSPLSLLPLGVNIQPPSTSSSTTSNLSKRASNSTVASSIADGVQTGTFYDTQSKGKNVTILGGHFTVNSSIQNLAFITGSQNNAVTGVTNNTLGGDNLIQSLLVVGNLLYIGGAINTTINGDDVEGLAIWDLANNAFANPQPQPLQGDNGNSSTVSMIVQQPNAKLIYTIGSFTQVAGGFACPGVCVYNPDESRFFVPGNGFSGVASSATWTDSDTLVVGGDLRLNNTEIFLASYKVSTTTWSAFTNSTSLPGPVTALNTGTGLSVLYVGGEAKGLPFIQKWDGKTWTDVTGGLLAGSSLKGLQPFELSQPHKPNALFDSSITLMATGNLLLPNSNINTSVALFDGASWSPFAVTRGSTGSTGSVGGFFSATQHTFGQAKGHLSKGLVVLISLAIALGLIFLLVVIGVLASYIRRRREGYSPAPTRPMPVAHNPADMQDRVPPEQLFSSMGQSGGRSGAPHI